MKGEIHTTAPKHLPIKRINILNNIFKQEALSSISSVGQWAYTEYSSFSGPPEGE